MKNKMDKPLTGYLALFGFTVLSVANILILIFSFNPELNNLTQVLFGFFSSLTMFPHFLLEIADYEISFITVCMCLLILCIDSAYFVLPFITLRKSSKNINGVLMLILSIDILPMFLIMFGMPIVAIVNILFKIVLIALCGMNIKWYNENYELI